MIYYGLEWRSLDTYFQMKEISAPGTPPADEVRLYAKDNGSGVSALYYKNDAGVEKDLSGGLTGSGAANRMAYWSGTTVLAANVALTSTRIPFADSNGLPTDSANLFWDNTNFAVTVRSSAAVLRGFVAEHYQSSADGGLVIGRKARGTSGTPVATAADDVLLDLAGAGYQTVTGAFSGTRGAVRIVAGEAFTNTAQGTYLTLETTPTGSTTRAERFRVGPSGQWGIGGATFGTSRQFFTSGGASAAPTWSNLAIGDTLTSGTAGSILFVASGPVISQNNSNFFWNNSSIFLGIGTNSPTDKLHIVDTENAGFRGDMYNAVDGFNMRLRRARGSVGTPTQVLSGDSLFRISGFGYHSGGAFSGLKAQIAAIAHQDFTSSAQGTYIAFFTTADGATTSLERMRIGANGAVGIGGATDPNPLATLLSLGGTYSPSTANTNGFMVSPTFTGSADGVQGFSNSPGFGPSASISIAYGCLNFPFYNPDTGVTITTATSFYNRIDSGSLSGSITTAIPLLIDSPALGTIKPGTIIGAQISNQGSSGISAAVGLYILNQSGATVNYDLGFSVVDTTAAGAYYGRVPVLYNGLTKYIHVFDA